MAQLIRNDRIDILVDLAGHMGGHRLTMFARKPAPVQVTQFNYPDTTGMSAMDCRFSDALAEPVGMSERYSTETVVRLPHCAWCYHPGFAVPEVKALPAIGNGYVTFTSLNKPLDSGQSRIRIRHLLSAPKPPATGARGTQRGACVPRRRHDGEANTPGWYRCTRRRPPAAGRG